MNATASSTAQAKKSFQRMKSILKTTSRFTQEERAVGCYIEPILMYGCETWTISKLLRKTTEMWFLRRMLRISTTARETNETVLREVDVTRSRINRIHKRQENLFWQCVEKRESRTSCDNWNDRRKTHQGKTA